MAPTKPLSHLGPRSTQAGLLGELPTGQGSLQPDMSEGRGRAVPAWPCQHLCHPRVPFLKRL